MRAAPRGGGPGARARRARRLAERGAAGVAARRRRHRKPRRRLTADDERALAERIQTWGDVEARNALVLANIGLVHMVVNQIHRPAVRRDDLVQEGILGLLRATETFDPDRNVRFSTYCVHWVRAMVQRCLQHLDRDDVPIVAGAAMADCDDGRRRRPRASAFSIDEPIDGNDDRSLGDTLASADDDPERAVAARERGIALLAVFDEICREIADPRLRTILERRLLADEPETLTAVGDRLNMSREGARLLEQKLLRSARRKLAEFRESPPVPS